MTRKTIHSLAPSALAIAPNALQTVKQGRLKMNQRTMFCVVALLGLFTVGLISDAASAAVMIQRQRGLIADPLPEPNLTDMANQDWVLGISGSGPAYGNRMAGGDGSISQPTFLKRIARSVGGSSLKFSYDDGISPISSSGATVNGMADDLLSTVGSGFEVNIEGLGSPQTAYIWVSGFNADGQFTAFLGPDTVVFDESASLSYGGSTSKAPVLYTVSFTTANPGDILKIRYEVKSINGSNAHVLLSAIALSAIPEPASLALLGLGGLLMLPRRGR